MNARRLAKVSLGAIALCVFFTMARTVKADTLTYNFTIPDNDATASQNSDNAAAFGGVYGCTTPGSTHDCWLGNTYSPSVTGNPGAPFPSGGIYGQVTLTLVTGANCGTAANCIQVAIAMASGFAFGGSFPDQAPGSGPPAAAFAFDDSLSVTSTGGLPSGYSLTTGPALDDPFGPFSAYLQAPSVTNGSLINTLSDLTFYVAKSNNSAFSSVSQLVKSNNNWPSPCSAGPGPGPGPSCDGFFFAVHAYAQNSNGTFDSQVGAINPAATSAPEPSSLILLLCCAPFVIAGLLRRRFVTT